MKRNMNTLNIIKLKNIHKFSKLEAKKHRIVPWSPKLESTNPSLLVISLSTGHEACIFPCLFLSVPAYLYCSLSVELYSHAYTSFCLRTFIVSYLLLLHTHTTQYLYLPLLVLQCAFAQYLPCSVPHRSSVNHRACRSCLKQHYEGHLRILSEVRGQVGGQSR